MYIALISLHALVMVGLHFLRCFEEDWTSEYELGLPPAGAGATRAGWLLLSSLARGPFASVDLLRAYGLAREAAADAQLSLEKEQPLTVSPTGTVAGRTPPGRPAGARPPWEGAPEAGQGGGPARRGERLFQSLNRALDSKATCSNSCRNSLLTFWLRCGDFL